MATINYAAREINVKIVYYGPALSGKTTNLQIIHKKVPQESKSDMVSLATESDRTLFFDFLPIDLGKIKGFTTKIQLYTVPGQVYYNATRKLVLRGVDGIVFVADSSADKLAENVESLDNMEENLAEYGYSLKAIPIVLQFNKRDCDNPLPVEELEKKLNRYRSSSTCAVAKTGEGVFDTLKLISKEVIDVLNKKYEGAAASAGGGNAVQPAAPKTVSKPVVQPAAEIDLSQTMQAPKQSEQNGNFSDVFLDGSAATPVSAHSQEKTFQDITLEDSINSGYNENNAGRETKTQEAVNTLNNEIELDDMFDAAAPIAAAAPNKQFTEQPKAKEDTFGEISLDTQFVEKKEIETPPANSSPFLEDVLTENNSSDNKQNPTVSIDANPIRAAFENKYSDGWIPPENVLFTSIDTDARKTERILATKKKPVNPKYKKSFLDNLFKNKPLE